MKTLVSILMTILGILSPALSSQAQEAGLFPGEFKEIYSIDDFTEGYYLIVIPSSDRTNQLVALSGVKEKSKKKILWRINNHIIPEQRYSNNNLRSLYFSSLESRTY